MVNAIGHASDTSQRKKYVTRACDACKKRKSKCDGHEPCSRCISSDIVCAYKSSYNRVQRRHQAGRQTRDRRQRLGATSQATDASTTPQLQALLDDNRDDANEDPPTPIPLEHDEGDASVHTFLRRVSGHLALVGQGLPRYLFKREEESLSDLDGVQTFILPPEEVSQKYLECFFEHSNVTYRYLHRERTFKLLARVYKEENAVLQDHTKMATILLVLGLGCVWTASWRNESLPAYKQKASKLLQAGRGRLEKAQSTFPPTLGVLQANVIKCQLELAFNRYNSAWMTVGTAVRLGQMIDFQKEQPLSDPVDEFCRRGVFWALYMVDRYLSASLGRPMAIREEDVVIPLPSPTVNARISAEESRITEGVKAHARIVGQAITRLYSRGRKTVEPRDVVIADLEREIEAWLQDTPIFFHPQDEASSQSPESGFYDVKWIFRRQQLTIRSAFYFANMLIYREHLLMEFLHQAPSTPVSTPPSDEIKKCIDNALAMAKMAGAIADDINYNAVYWTTSYFIFCAISILLVYLTLYRDSEDRSLIESVVEQAMEGHRKLNHTTHINSAQKLLEESRFRAKHVRNTNAQSPRADNETATAVVAGVDEESTNVQPETQPQINADLPVDNAPRLSDIWGGQAVGTTSDFLDGLQYEMDSLGDANGFGMIMDIGFDNTTIAPNFPGSHGMY